MVQAANGLGVVTLIDNFGAYFRVGVDPAAPPQTSQQQTSLTLISPPGSGAYNTSATFTATLNSAGSPQANQTIVFSLAGQSRPATTDNNGQTSVTFRLTSPPGSYQAGASFGGANGLAAAASSSPFTITRRNTVLTLTPTSATVPAGTSTGIVATLTDDSGGPLGLHTVFFNVGGQFRAVSTNALGQAPLGVLDLSAGSYTVTASFASNPPPGVTADDPNYNPSSATGSLTLTSPGIAPQITSTPVTSATQGQPYSYQVTASGSPAPTFSLLTAPAGMAINATTGLISWTPQVLPCPYQVTVQAANGISPNATQSFTIQVAAASTRQAVSPVLECVVDRGAGWSNPATRYVARFGYNNPNSFTVAIPVGPSNNKFTPTPFDRGQTTVFLPGRNRFTFEVAFNGNNLVWHLDRRISTASSNPAQRCK